MIHTYLALAHILSLVKWGIAGGFSDPYARVLHTLSAARNMAFPKVIRSLKEGYCHYMGVREWSLAGEKEAISQLEQTRKFSVVCLATESMAKSTTAQQDYLLIIYFHQEKKNISLGMCQFLTRGLLVSLSLGKEVIKSFWSLCFLTVVVIRTVHKYPCSLFLDIWWIVLSLPRVVFPCDCLCPMICKAPSVRMHQLIYFQS